MYALYEPPAPPGLADDPDRRGVRHRRRHRLRRPRRAHRGRRRRASSPRTATSSHQVPFALTPGPPISTKPLQDSIDATARDVAAGLPAAARRRGDRHPAAPHAAHPQRRPAAAHGADIADDITAALLDLDSSYLAVHGPPGTGKTFTAARVIARLVNDHGWRIGVVAQSHAVVENLFGDVDRRRRRPGAGRQEGRHRERRAGRRSTSTSTPASSPTTTGCVIGGTAWDFANDNRVPPGSLDLLVIDEAGQFSLANTIAVAPRGAQPAAARRPAAAAAGQPGHPSRTGRRRPRSAGWSTGTHTLPAERGYFLDRSYRMHPAVCEAVSRLSYDGRLRSHDAVTAARRLDGVAPGVRDAHRRPRRQRDRQPRGGRGDRRRDRRLLGRAWTDERRHPAAGPGRRARRHAVQRAGGAAARAGSTRPGLADVRGRAPSTSSRAGRRRWCSCR